MKACEDDSERLNEQKDCSEDPNYEAQLEKKKLIGNSKFLIFIIERMKHTKFNSSRNLMFEAF